MKSPDFNSIISSVAIVLTIIGMGLVLLFARRIALLEDQPFSLELIIRSFDTIYFAVILPRANAFHAALAGILAILILLNNNNNRKDS